jgi:transposase InsO family protein
MRVMHIGELLHMDLVGPMEITSFNNKRYFLIVVDNYSLAVWTSAIASKTEVIQKLCEYIAQLENAFRVKVQALIIDNGTEFVNSEMNQFLKGKGIGLFTSVLYSPQQNRVAERGIWTIMEGAQAMLYAVRSYPTRRS